MYNRFLHICVHLIILCLFSSSVYAIEYELNLLGVVPERGIQIFRELPRRKELDQMNWKKSGDKDWKVRWKAAMELERSNLEQQRAQISPEFIPSWITQPIVMKVGQSSYNRTSKKFQVFYLLLDREVPMVPVWEVIVPHNISLSMIVMGDMKHLNSYVYDLHLSYHIVQTDLEKRCGNPTYLLMKANEIPISFQNATQHLFGSPHLLKPECITFPFKYRIRVDPSVQLPCVFPIEKEHPSPMCWFHAHARLSYKEQPHILTAVPRAYYAPSSSSSSSS